MTDWYKVLQISRQASDKEIKAAYRKLAKKYHPDAHPGDKKCEAYFKEITEAYTILSDAKKRKKFDEELDGLKQTTDYQTKAKRQNKTQTEETGTVDFQNISRNFERFFGFDPKTKEVVNEEKLNPNLRTGNPLDTTNIFEAFMGNMKR
ncbi:chaperone protein DnaJ [Lachnospiraceae bacterium]|nr:chaperone protein DnaJ [Lachnospiraceae bacterium]